MKKFSSQEVNESSGKAPIISLACLENKKYGLKKDIITDHDCSQSDCHAYDSTSTESDVEKRIRIKATKFCKSYPKRFLSNRPNGSKTPLHYQAEDLQFSNSENEGAHIKRCDSSNQTQSQADFHSDCIEMFSSYDSDTSSSSNDTFTISEDPLRLDDHNPGTDTKIDITGANSRMFEDSSDTVNINDEISKLKPIRPFKTFPENPLSLSIGFDTAKISVNRGKPENYDDFRKRMLGNKYLNKSAINKNMRRFRTYRSDKSYRERRNKNNMAAKRSRDARKAKEDELAIRCAYLEQENMFLKKRVAEMEEEKRKSSI